ncbi:shikimate dehydrogenase family protein [Geodermatophilus sp. SYSU D00697]
MPSDGPPAVDGTTRLCLMLAHPSGHLRAPQAFNKWFAAAGVNALMVAADVRPEALAAFVAGLRGWANLAGCAVTVPHKEAVVPLLDDLADSAARTGSVNTIRREPSGRLVGATFDGLGFVAGLRVRGHEPTDRRVGLVGAGGAGRAIAFELARSGVAALVVLNRTSERAERLAAEVRRVHPGLPVSTDPGELAAVDVVVNATRLGLDPDDALPLDIGALRPGALVADIVMQPDTTALLAAAEGAGHPVHRGRYMRDAQVEPSVRFLGLHPEVTLG